MVDYLVVNRWNRWMIVLVLWMHWFLGILTLDSNLTKDNTVATITEYAFNGKGERSTDSVHAQRRQLLTIPVSWKWYEWTKRDGGDYSGQVETGLVGTAIALSDDGLTLAVGSPGAGSGAVFVQTATYEGDLWNQRGSPQVGPTEGAEFGSVIAMNADGSRFFASAYLYSYASLVSAGYALPYKFDPINGDWDIMAEYFIGEGDSYRLGKALAMNGAGDIIAYSEPGYDLAPLTDIGRVKVLKWVSASQTWTTMGSQIIGKDEYDAFGSGVIALSEDGTVIAVGSPESAIASTGVVRVYQFASTFWSQVGSDLQGDVSLGQFGFSLALSASGSFLAVGAPMYEPSYGNDEDIGAVYVYYYLSGEWSRLSDPILGDSSFDLFGYDLAMSDDGSILAVGATQAGLDAGYVRTFWYNATASVWTQIGSDLRGNSSGDCFGNSVTLNDNGTFLAVGIPYSNGAVAVELGGAVEVYSLLDLSTATPTEEPTYVPSRLPTAEPTHVPTRKPTVAATFAPTENPTLLPSAAPTWIPTCQPSASPSATPSVSPSVVPSLLPSIVPTVVPTTRAPSRAPTTTSRPSLQPSVYPLVTDYPLTATLSGAAANDYFGSSVALSADGTIMAVGAYGDDRGADNAGSVRVLQYNSATFKWSNRGQLITGTGVGEITGRLVTLSGDGLTLVMSGYLDEPGCLLPYQWNSTTSLWVTKGTTLCGSASGDAFGSAAALNYDGSVLVVGASGVDILSGGGDAGCVYVYTWDEDAWTLKGDPIEGSNSAQYVGYSVAINYDGTVIAVGAVGMNTAFVYEWSGLDLNWVVKGDVITAATDYDQTGLAVALNAAGDVVLVGSLDVTGGGYLRVFVYNADMLVWEFRGSGISYISNGDEYSVSLAVSQDGYLVAMGSPVLDYTNVYSGPARVYQYNTGLGFYEQLGNDLVSPDSYDKFGNAIAMSADGSVVVVAAMYGYGNASSSGNVYVYKLDSQTPSVSPTTVSPTHSPSRTPSRMPTPVPTERPSHAPSTTASPSFQPSLYAGDSSYELDTVFMGTTSNTFFGSSVALSADGTVLVVGARADSSGSTNAGAVYAYYYNATTFTWNERGQAILGTVTDDNLGIVVAVSDDGLTLAAACIYSYPMMEESGGVYVYQWVETAIKLPS